MMLNKRVNSLIKSVWNSFLSIQLSTFLTDLRCILVKPDICLKNVGGNVANRIISEGFFKLTYTENSINNRNNKLRP